MEQANPAVTPTEGAQARHSAAEPASSDSAPRLDAGEVLSITGEVCEVGDVIENICGFRMHLEDGRVITVTGLMHEEARSIGTCFFRSVTIKVRKSS